MAVYLAWSLGHAPSEIEMWGRVVGSSARAYYRRLRSADTDRLRAKYPELELAAGLAIARHQAKLDGIEERRRRAWEQVRRLNSQTN